MAKKKKSRKPKVGDTVFLIGEPNHIAMLLEKIFIEENEDYGFCVWSTSKMVKGELKHTSRKGNFLLSRLTLDAPPTATQIFLI